MNMNRIGEAGRSGLQLGERGNVDVEEVLSAAFWIGVVAVVAYGAINLYSRPGQSTDPHEVKNSVPASVACRQPGQEVPDRTSINVTEDKRTDMIYPCAYFNDMRLPANTRLPLGKISQENFDHTIQNFSFEGNIGGFAVFGTGGLSGNSHSTSHSDTVRERMYLVNIQDEDGNYVFTTLDKAAKVRVNQCNPKIDKVCTPSIVFKTSNKPLWYKDPGMQQHLPFRSQDVDRTSIWQIDGVHGDTDRSKDEYRTSIVSLLIGSDGNPLPPGQVAAELSEKIIITIPKA